MKMMLRKHNCILYASVIVLLVCSIGYIQFKSLLSIEAKAFKYGTTKLDTNTTTLTLLKPDNDLPPFVIIDCIMYNGEPIVLTRLEMLNETVDYFYITEATVTFSGLEKETLFKDLHADDFKLYKHKIRWNIYEPPPDWESKEGISWKREEAIRNDILNKIRDDVDKGVLPSPNKIVLVNTDADEIPNTKVLEELRPGKKWYAHLMVHPLHLEMNFFYFNYNWVYNEKWTKGNVVSGQHVLEGTYDLENLRMVNKVSRIPDGGYHLSYALSVDDIIRKIESFSHQEYNKAKYKSREHIRRSISNEENLFYIQDAGQKWTHYDYKQLPLPLQRFHLEVCKIQNVSPDDGKSLI